MAKLAGKVRRHRIRVVALAVGLALAVDLALASQLCAVIERAQQRQRGA